MISPSSTISAQPTTRDGAVEKPKRREWRTSLIVVLLVAGVWAWCLRTPAVWRTTGIGDTPVPFLDLYALLAAGELADAHGDPFKPNPLDLFHRPHVYTTWWLVTGTLGLTRADTAWLGQTILGVSLVAAVFLIRPRGAKEALQTGLVLCSPALLMAVNRGNNDWVVFAIACGALGCLRFDSPFGRGFGVVLLAVSAVLKYYPLATLVVLLGARSRREWIGGLTLFAIVLALAWPGLKPGLESAARFKPSPNGLFAFGAPALFHALGFRSAAAWIIPSFALAGWCGWLARNRWRGDSGPRATPSSSQLEFAAGAAVIVGCFFLGASYVYKMIFAVWLLPWFWRGAVAGAEKPWRQIGAGLLLAVLWWEGLMALVINLVLTPWSMAVALRVLDATIVISQLLTWGLVVCLLRWLALYAVDRIRELQSAETSAIVTL